MFTGIVEEQGIIELINQNHASAFLQIKAKKIIEDAKIGDSISVNGCCLTIIELNQNMMSFNLVPETLSRTTFKNFKKGDNVNLERALKAHDRVGGHFVQGHVDGVGSIINKMKLQDDSSLITISLQKDILKYVIEKGSIVVEGVSLTVTEITEETFSFAMIPHTALVTTLGHKNVGDQVNIEVDLIAKYIEKFTDKYTLNRNHQ